MDVDAYLARIGATRAMGLAEIHAAHLRHVPFEDYDIHLGVPLSLDVDDLHAKIVGRRRGGFCYELNGLFAAAVAELGYDVTFVSAFELVDDGTRGPDFEHMRLIVTTPDGPVVADVGQGARWAHPVPLVPGEHGDVRVERDGDLWWTSTRAGDDGWNRDWTFTLAPRELAEYLPRCRYQEHDPASHFVARRLASLAVPGGRIALLNGVFSETGRPDRTVDEATERALLAERFGIVFDGRWAPA